MKKILILISIVLVFSITFNIPKYRELNNIKIIESIGYDCLNNNIYLKEIIPKKDDNGIEYKYKVYKIKNNISDEYYLKSTKYIITNCDNTNTLISKYNLNPKYIYHTNKDIEKELRES